MIDYLLNFANEATAKSNPIVGAYFISGVDQHGVTVGIWRADICTPGMQFWDNVNDTVVAGRVQHVLLPGFWLLIALPAPDAELDTLTARVLVVDHTALRAATTNAQRAAAVLYSVYSFVQLKTKRFQPQFAGRAYNF